jgi:hypothetical protein
MVRVGFRISVFDEAFSNNRFAELYQL